MKSKCPLDTIDYLKLFAVALCAAAFFGEVIQCGFMVIQKSKSKPSPIVQSVSVTQLTNNAESEWRYWKTNVPKPIVQVSEYPKVEPELPREFLSTNTLPTNELLMLNEIQVQEQLLIWLNQLDQTR